MPMMSIIWTIIEGAVMRRRKRQPTHPGVILREHYLEQMDLSITQAAGRLGVSRKTLSKLVNERGAVTPKMALRLSRAFSTSPQLWLNLQQTYDLWKAERETGWRQVTVIEAHAV